jgi:hypothetical protein
MGRPRRFNTYDQSVDLTRKTSENFGLSRQNAAGIGSSLKGIPPTAPSGQGGENIDGSKLSLQFGGELKAALGFTASSSAISAGDLDISVDSSGDAKQIRSIIFVAPESGPTDVLDTITGQVYDGQMLLLTGVAGNTITITHGSGSAGQILCPGDADFTLSGDDAVLLFDDVTAGTQSWRLVTGGGMGSGGLTEPIRQTIVSPTIETPPTTTDIEADNGNIFKLTLDKDIDLAINHGSSTKYQLIHLLIVQNGTGS